jgi:quercetin dioxygenase-like cupin family protein
MDRTLHRHDVTDLALRADDLPWVPQAEGIWFRPFRISPERGTWTNLLKFAAAGRMNRHRHVGAVEAWVIQGRWRYLEHGWVAEPGSFVFEPPGDVHTLMVEPGEEMLTLFHIEGPMEYLDDRDEVIAVETAQTKLDKCERFCREHGVEPLPVVY